MYRAYCICNADMTYIKSQFCLKNRLRMQNNKTGASSESQTRHRTDSTVVKLSSKIYINGVTVIFQAHQLFYLE